MITCDFLLITFIVADDVLISQIIEFAKMCTKLCGFLVYRIKIRGVGQIVFTDFKSDVTVVSVTTCMPSSMVPGQGLISSDSAIFKLSNKCMDTDLSTTRSMLVPMVVVLVLSQDAIIWPNISAKIGIVRPSAVHHDAFRFDFPTCFITFIFCKD